MKVLCLFGSLLLVVTLLALPVSFLMGDEPSKPTEDRNEKVVSQHDLSIGKTHIAYTATAGYLTLGQDADASPPKPEGKIFYVAYVLKGTDPANRPIAFCFNGGPGCASAWLNLGLGPRRVDLPDDGRDIPPPYRLVDNNETWLDRTDLVFVDPIPTGYSRATHQEDTVRFEGYENDLQAMTDFIQSYLIANGRWLSPKILVGESYGTIRVAGLADRLHMKANIAVNGIVLMSQALNSHNNYDQALILPSYAATAWYHGKIAPRYRSLTLEQVCDAAESFAVEDYEPALFQGDVLPKEKARQIASELSDFTGIAADELLTNSLELPPDYEQKVLHSGTQCVGAYDSRQIQSEPWHSPVSNAPTSAFGAAFNAYLANELGFHVDAVYNLLAPVDWTSSKADYLNNFAILRTDMDENPELKILITGGRYDLVTPYFAAKYGLNHLHLSSSARSAVEIDLFPSGHMPYIDKVSRLLLKADFERWMDQLKI